MEIKLREAFKENAQNAIFAIVAFIIVYVILLTLGVLLAGACLVLGFGLCIAAPHYLTILLGVGLAASGLLVLLFLIKFLFGRNKADRSHLKEITRKDEPRLFAMIDDIVEKTGTDFPKHVYLSAQVNASVFYDSGFWSMFFPVKKNLEIGLGLVNSLRETELKAVLAHEFGHFSQRSMKVGSYVYQVNHVIFNLLYDNGAFENWVRRWASMSAVFTIFVVLAYKVIQGIQWLLGKMYAFVNQKYMALSREMEFHADEIAAHVTGYEALQTALLRLDLSNSAMQSVFQFYNDRIVDNKVSENIFKDQMVVMHWIAQYNHVAIDNDLPTVEVADVQRLNRSKLVVADQWASHPRVEDRINRLKRTELYGENISLKPANELFENLDEHQAFFSKKLFDEIPFEGDTEQIAVSDFPHLFEDDMKRNSYPDVFCGYFDSRVLQELDWKQLPTLREDYDVKQSFDNHWIDLSKEAAALTADVHVLKFLTENKGTAKSFDYDGKKYLISQSKELVEQLEARLSELNEKFKKNEEEVFAFCLQLESKTSKPARLIDLYEKALDFQGKFDHRVELVMKIQQAMQFVTFEIPVEQIIENFSEVRKLEKDLRLEMQEVFDEQLLEKSVERGDIHVSVVESMFKYLEEPMEYFSRDRYIDENLNLFFEALNSFHFALNKLSFASKKELLEYTAALIGRSE